MPKARSPALTHAIIGLTTPAFNNSCAKSPVASSGGCIISGTRIHCPLGTARVQSSDPWCRKRTYSDTPRRQAVKSDNVPRMIAFRFDRVCIALWRNDKPVAIINTVAEGKKSSILSKNNDPTGWGCGKSGKFCATLLAVSHNSERSDEESCIGQRDFAGNMKAAAIVAMNGTRRRTVKIIFPINCSEWSTCGPPIVNLCHIRIAVAAIPNTPPRTSRNGNCFFISAHTQPNSCLSPKSPIG